MARPEIVDRATFEILLDDGRAHVRGTRNRGRVPELVRDARHHGGNSALRLGFGVRDAAFGESYRRDQRPAPRSEILRSELLAHVRPDVLVQERGRERCEVAVSAVAEQSAAALELEQLTYVAGELGVDDHAPDAGVSLPAEAEADAFAADVDVALRQRRDP